MTEELTPITLILAGILALLFLILLGSALVLRISRFCSELSYVNMELRRCEASMRRAWRRRRRRLWLEFLIPFYRG